MNLYKFHSNPSELLYGEDKDLVLGKMVRHRLGYTSRFTPTLVEAILSQLGASWEDGAENGTNIPDILDDIYNHGIDGGFTGFTYYNETKKFYTNNRDEINDFIEHESLDLGFDTHIDSHVYDLGVDLEEHEMGAISMVLGFNCADNSIAEDIYFTMYDAMGQEADSTVANCISWYVVESLASEYHDIMYE
jgi:hypothetical protein